MRSLPFGLLTVLKCALLHAALTTTVWLGPLTYAAFGVGFKDRDQWTLIDQVVSVTALPVANLLTTPGRYITWDGLGGFVVPALITSFSWGLFIAAIYGTAKRMWLRRWR
jgi:hypothetical protein